MFLCIVKFFFYDRSYIGRLGSFFCQNHMAFGKGKRAKVLWGCISVKSIKV